MMGNRSIGWKLGVGFGLVLLLTVAVGVAGFVGLRTLRSEVDGNATEAIELRGQGQDIYTHLLQARHAEKDFMQLFQYGMDEATDRYLPVIEQNLGEIRLLTEIIRSVHPGTDAAELTQALDQALGRYRVSVLGAIAAIGDRGVTDEGLMGELQFGLERMEAIAFATEQDHLEVIILGLRQSLQDYLILGDQNFIEAIADGVVRLKEAAVTLPEGTLPVSEVTELLSLADAYGRGFTEVVDKNAQISVLLGATRDAANDIEPLAAELAASGRTALTTSLEDVGRVGDFVAILIIVTAAAALILGATVATLLGGGISRGVGEVSGALGRMADGDLTHEIDITSKDEIGQMADSYRNMRVELSELISNVQQSAGDVATASSELTGISSQVDKATRNIAATSQEVANATVTEADNLGQAMSGNTQMADAIEKVTAGARTQSRQVMRTQQSVEAMLRDIRVVEESVRSVSDASENAEAAARAGDATMGRTVARMRAINTTALAMADKVAALGERSNEIATVVSAIRDLTDHANQLALDAATEAARAGEHGQGFMLVANEVRKLAERTGQATNQIVNVVDSVQQGIAEAVMELEAGAREVAAGTELAAEVGDSLDAVRLAIELTARRTELISGAAGHLRDNSSAVELAMGDVMEVAEANASVSREVNAQVDAVNLNLHSIVSAVEETSSSSLENSNSTENVAAQVRELAASSERLRELADRLAEDVDWFQIEDRPGNDIPGPDQPGIEGE
jgi:methyl-accepting chemotaxis protein